MKLSDVDTHSFILSLIDKAADAHGRYNLAAGNCGTFSLALTQRLDEENIRCSVLVLFRLIEGVQNITDLAYEEPDIYHVVVEVGGKMYDAIGETNPEKMVELSKEYYGDSRPAYLSGVGINNQALATIIEHDTNWSIPSHVFYESMK